MWELLGFLAKNPAKPWYVTGEGFFPKNMCDILPKKMFFLGRVGYGALVLVENSNAAACHFPIWCRYSTPHSTAWLKLMQVESEAKPECGKPNDPNWSEYVL